MKACKASARKWISEDVHSQFISLKPYKYLQVCYTEVILFFLRFKVIYDQAVVLFFFTHRSMI